MLDDFNNGSQDCYGGIMTALITLTPQQKAILEQFVRRRNSPKWLVQRAQILLELDAGGSIKQTARRLNLSRNTVRLWCRRWQQNARSLVAQGSEQTDDTDLTQQIETLLADSPRLGKPPTFSAEAVVKIVAIGLEAPQKFGRPISHWTPRELADEVQKQQVVPSISPRSVGRFLKGGRPQTTPQPLLAESRYRRSGPIQSGS